MIPNGMVKLELGLNDESPRRKSRYSQSNDNVRSFRNYCSDVFKDSMLNGVSSIGKAKGCFQRTMKLFILMCSLGGFLYQSYEFLELYWQYNVVMSSGKLASMTKPAITICDENIIKRTFICKMKPDLCKYYEDEEKFCKTYPDYCKVPPGEQIIQYAFEDDYSNIEDYLTYNVTKNGGFQLMDNLLNCTWISYEPSNKRSTSFRCGDIHFVRGMNSEKIPVPCHSIDSHHKRRDRHFEQFQYDQLLRIELKWEHHETILKPGILHPRRYYMSIHHPREMSNPMSGGFYVQEGTHYKVDVTQTDIVRKPPPYSSMCRDYMMDWEKNDGNGPTKRQECYRYCEIDIQFRNYGCVLKEITYPHNKKLCQESGLLEKEIHFEIQECHDKCKDACIETEFIAVRDVSSLIDKEEEDRTGYSSIVLIDIEFSVKESKKKLYKPKYESVEVFSYLGGYLGMWLGWSLLAVFDFIEDIIRLCQYPFEAKKKRKITSVTINKMDRFL